MTVVSLCWPVDNVVIMLLNPDDLPMSEAPSYQVTVTLGTRKVDIHRIWVVVMMDFMSQVAP